MSTASAVSDNQVAWALLADACAPPALRQALAFEARDGAESLVCRGMVARSGALAPRRHDRSKARGVDTELVWPRVQSELATF